MALSVSLSVGSKTPSHSIEGQVGEVDSLAPFQGANAIPCPLGMDIEYAFRGLGRVVRTLFLLEYEWNIEPL
jgi:hypothetical protein